VKPNTDHFRENAGEEALRIVISLLGTISIHKMQYPIIRKSLLAWLLLPFACTNESPNPTPVETIVRVKSVETTGTSWTSREDYTYNEQGQLTAINWKRQTPYETVGSEEYFYNNTGQLSHIIKKITGLVPEEVQYKYMEDQLIATFSMVNGKKVAYQIYEYDDEGRLDLVEFYSYNSDANGYDRKGEHHYSYFSDGNVKEIQKFDFLPEQAELIWNSTKAFTSYLEGSHPISPYAEVPGINTQHKLPNGYELRYPSTTYPYSFTYQLRPDGYPVERRATYNDGSVEMTVYTYAR
jgi:YD repeat-containing protein